MFLQHNICSFKDDEKGGNEYIINSDNILRRVRFPKYIYNAKTLYGDAAELVTEEILQNGKMMMSEVIQNVTSKLNEALVNAGNTF